MQIPVCISTVLLVLFLISTREMIEFVSTSSHDQDKITTNENVFKTPAWKSRQVLGQNNTEKECSEVLKINSSLQCHFVKTTADCQLSEGFIQYLYLPYCKLPHGFAFFLLFLWLGFLFVVLGITADNYFCPSLVVISKTLKLSQNIAGVTFLAYGNGAPDIFSAIAAFTHSKESKDSVSAELGIEALLGAGIFVTTMVMGVISLVAKNFTVTTRPFIRDVLFYLGAVAWMSIALYKKELTMLQSIGLILMYVGYVIVVIGGRYIYQTWKRKNQEREGILDINDDSASKPFKSLLGSQSSSTQSLPATKDERTPLLYNNLFPGMLPILSYRVNLLGKPLKKFCYDVVPFTALDWQQAGIFEKMFMLIKAPAAFFLNITTPVIDYAEPDRRWNKWLNVMQCVTGPMFVVFAIKAQDMVVGGKLPLWALTLCIGIIIGTVVALVTKSDHPPKCQWIFAYLAFIVAVLWIYITANEIVNLLETFGVAFKLSDAILGLTFLAWGNSIGDLVSNAAMSRKGFPNMGASACFGGPMLNLLLGIGISCTYLSVKQGHSVRLPHQHYQYIISAGFLTASLASSGIIIPLMGFKVPRLYGAYLVFLYIAYLTTSIVVEVGHFN